MRSFALHVRFPTGTVLIGGHSAVARGISTSHAVDRDGRPIVPATALRGALRETLEAVLRGVSRGACDSGSGIDPAQPAPAIPPVSCTVDGGMPCIPCRLFGTRRPALGPAERSFSSLILGDAVLAGEDPVDWLERQHVAISRSRRSAEEHRLFTRKTPDLLDRELVSRGYTVSPDIDGFLEAAVRGTKHLGSGRSTGLARVDLELEWLEDVQSAVSSRAVSAESDTVGIRIRLESPTAIGTSDASDNYRSTRQEIPGSVLRGALGFAIARTHAKSLDPELEALADEKEGAHFGFLFPVDPSRDAPAEGRAAPWPVTARACKAHPRKHGVVDTLLDRISIELVTSSDQAERVHRGAVTRCGAHLEEPQPHGRARCGAPLRNPKGTRRSSKDPAKRVVTRVSIERRSTSAREGALFSYEMLDPGAVFEGTIRNVPERSRELLASALALPVYVGRGSSSGWGRVSIEVVDPAPLPPLRERGEAFEAALRLRLNSASIPTDDAEFLLPITFLAPLLPTDSADDGRADLARRLEVIDWVVVARRFARDGGWDQRTGRPFAELAVLPGAVYVARLERPWRDMLEMLETLERAGVGRRRHQGYGQLLLFDPFISNRGNNP